MRIALGYPIAVLYVALCVGVACLLSRCGLPRPYTRKTVHILVGFEWVILAAFFGAGIHTLLVSLLFTALLALDARKKLLAPLSSDGGNARGTVYYGLSMSVMALVCLFAPAMMPPFGIAVFCTSLGDGFAGVVGQAVRRFNPKIFREKTLFGALACLVFSFLSVFFLSRRLSLGLSPVYCFAIALFAALTELFSSGGMDNITLPLGVFALSAALLYLPSFGRYLIAVLLMPAVVGLALGRRLLTPAATAAAFCLGAVVTAAFGSAGFLLLLAFLAGSIPADRFKARFGRKIPQDEAPSEPRGLSQVLANGLAPGLLALLSFFLPLLGASSAAPLLRAAFAASVAEALADTSASGFGSAAKHCFDPFRGQRVPCGLSGGMSLPGTAASLIAGGLLALLAFALGFVGLAAVPLVGASAFLGAVFDSLLGSLLQVKYRCAVCGELTERSSHCGRPAPRARGLAFVGNDAVNFASACFAALLCTGLAAFLL